jgi:hypothetical protein
VQLSLPLAGSQPARVGDMRAALRDAHRRDIALMSCATAILSKGYTPAEALRFWRPEDFPGEARPGTPGQRRSAVYQQNMALWRRRRERDDLREARRRNRHEEDVWTMRGMHHLSRNEAGTPASALRRLFPRDFRESTDR